MSSGTIQSLVEFVERSVENATDEELMTIHTQIMTRISEETEKQRQANTELDPVEKVDKVVIVECAEELKKQCQQNTSIITLPMNIVVDSTAAQVGQRSQLITHLTLQDGQPANKMQNMKATLKSKVDGSCMQIEMVWKEQNTYQIEFTPTVRGRHQLEVMYNDKPMLREPVQMFVKIPPTMLGKPVKRIDVGKGTKFVTFNSSEEMLVTAGNEVITFNRSGKKLCSFTHKKLTYPTGLAVHGPNIYVTDNTSNTLLKFDKTGKLLKSVGQKGSGKGEFDHPIGMSVVGDEVIVCDAGNCRLQVFTPDLVFVRQFGSEGSGYGQFAGPFDVTHDQDRNLYVTDWGNNRVQVFNTQGEFIRILVAPDHIIKPTGITCVQEVVYICQWIKNGKLRLYLKNGKAVCSIPYENDEGELWGIAVDQDGFIHVCSSINQHNLIIVL